MKPVKRQRAGNVASILSERYAAQPAYARAVQELHHQRCKADLMHALLSVPTHEARLDQILVAAFALVTKKYSPDFGRSRAASSLLRFTVDVEAKLFCLLFILSKEPEMQTVIQSRQTSEDGVARYESLLPALQGMFQQALSWPFSKVNIVDVVRNLVRAARKAYMMET